ncbi:hypothetical protein [Clostridium akagii]|uniref:hypothetical protein n=1 Tax=Clostridium akagii TaxID=91623 RepID=UPI0004798AE9|nr:hypothetical protein [Clostridium akagii]
MNEKEKLINALIDKHYNEDYDINLLNKSNDESKFENKIDSTLEKMDLANSVDFNFDIDTLNIIQTAVQIQTKRNSIKENIFFLMSSILILSLLSIIFIKFGIKFLIYFQLFLIFIMPWSLIPLSKHALRRNENE